MKNLVLVLTFVTLLGVFFVNVESTSPVQCPEKCYPCEPVDCPCGTYEDQCNCCDLCKKCKSESCSVLAGEVCEEGYRCGDPDQGYLAYVNGAHTCIPEKKEE
ncbi:hypothetical protein CDAR_443771 [Caerostris darwini]|uniref:IGFBP N-terminal domain-containing protein n=1 Tax=Caerostris darwini TaxID=1538125 RepID=A0AAV4XA83_9ARAC|nr:hypothetical protein CDAR_443771 [Caerostris darwini]